MRHFKWISALELDRWADTTGARPLLPELIRRLVHATVDPSEISHIDFPGGEETGRPGYDGITDVKKQNAKVPEGIAYWEMGTTAAVKGKLDDDYEKRIADRGTSLDFSKINYIAVTPRDYQHKKDWIEARQKAKQWKDVRVYDSSDLEQWLETAPSVAIWLSRHVSKFPEGLHDTAWHWESLIGRLKSPLPPPAALVSRKTTIDAFRAWVNGPPVALAVHGQSPQEVVDVFAAWLQSLDPKEQDPIASRTIVVESLEAWKSVSESRQPSILICSEHLELEPEQVAAALANKHHVLQPLSSIRTQSGANVVRLERMDRYELEKILRGANLSEQEAHSLAQQCGGSFSILKRRYSAIAIQQRPTWSKPPIADQLAPLVLAGAWNDTQKGDREMLAKLANRPYADARSIVNQLHGEPDAPVRWGNSIWEFLSPLDSWTFLHHALSPTQLDQWEAVTAEVLGVDDPALDLAKTDRWQAAVQNKVHPYSSELREGLAGSLALMATREKNEQITDTLPLQARVNRVVRAILPLNASWKRWATLGRLLPLLAEAAPETFLEAVEADLKSATPQLLELFGEEGSGFAGRAEHTGLLWALEGLAWSPTLLPRASLALAKLADIDPGGQWANRPKASLRDVFFSWMPHTSAPLKQRLQVLELLLRKNPKAGWKLILALLPHMHESIMQHHTPEWRFWAEGWKRDVNRDEYAATIGGIVKIALDGAKAVPGRWISLVDALPTIPVPFFQSALTALEEVNPAALSEADRKALWSEVRDLVQKHSYFDDARWALPKPTVERFAKVRDKLSPTDTVELALPLFKHGFRAEGHKGLSWDEQEKIRTEKRTTALLAVADKDGFTGILSLVQEADDIWPIGYILAQNVPERFEKEILPSMLSSESRNEREFASAYAGVRSHREPIWAEEALSREWTLAHKGLFAAQLPFNRHTWKRVEVLGDEAARAYWGRVRNYGIDLSPDDVAFAAHKLLEHTRPSTAIDVVAMNRDKNGRLSADSLTTFLEAVLRTPAGDERGQLDTYHIQELIEQLQKDSASDQSRLAQIEWAFLPLLDRDSALPTTLHKQLATSPDFFMELLTVLYRGEKESEEMERPKEIDPRKKALAEKAWHLLHEWSRIPGTQNDGTVDEKQLTDWVKSVREKADASDRLAVADLTIGEVLSTSPVDPDGVWPLTAVRNVIDEIDSRDIERGVNMGLFNSRGATSRALDEGGASERELAKKYDGYADALQTRWPRTAAILRDLAEGYRHDAEREDREAGERN